MSVLFVCSMARYRSKTAASIFGGKFAGVHSNADVVLTKKMLDDADVIVCMENEHRNKIRKKFKGYSHKIKVLGVPDLYNAFDSELIKILVEKSKVFL